MARRGPEEALLGYDLITETPDGHLIATSISGTDHALGLIGPRRARHCLVTTDAGVGAMLSAARPGDLVIVAPSSPTPRLARWLRKLVGTRTASFVCAAGEDDAPQLRACLPQAGLIGAAEPGSAPSSIGDRQADKTEHKLPQATKTGDDPPAPS